MEQRFCQSCGALLENDSMLGTEKNGNKNQDYCNLCYSEGKFTNECTMEEMINNRAQHYFTQNFRKHSFFKYTMDEAIASMKQLYPNLKRWKYRSSLEWRNQHLLDLHHGL